MWQELSKGAEGMEMLIVMLSLLLLASCEPWEGSRIPRLIFQGRIVSRETDR